VILRCRPFCRRELSRLLDAIRTELGLQEMPVSLALADDALMAELNRDYRGTPGPTNVLSFGSEGDEWGGEIVLDLDALEREAWLYGQDTGEHAARLLTHSVLHLAGQAHGPGMYGATEAAVESVAHLVRAPADILK
jgi:probable rRNA maturation factor